MVTSNVSTLQASLLAQGAVLVVPPALPQVAIASFYNLVRPWGATGHASCNSLYSALGSKNTFASKTSKGLFAGTGITCTPQGNSFTVGVTASAVNALAASTMFGGWFATYALQAAQRINNPQVIAWVQAALAANSGTKPMA